MLKKIIPDVVKDQKIAFVSAQASVREAAEIMAQKGIGALLVTKKDRLEGIITERDFLTKIVAKGIDSATIKVGAVMTGNPECVGPEDTALDALKKDAPKRIPSSPGGRWP